MAERKTSGKTRKPATKRKPASKKPTRQLSSETKKEIIIIGVIGFLLIWLLSNFGLLGKGGGFLSGLFFGLIGIQAYVMPVLLLPFLVVFIMNRNVHGMWQKYVATGILFWMISGLSEIFTYEKGRGPVDTFLYAYDNHTGGGFTGWLLAAPLVNLLTSFGAFLVIALLIVICLVVLSETFIMLNLFRSFRHRRQERKLSGRKKPQTDDGTGRSGLPEKRNIGKSGKRGEAEVKKGLFDLPHGEPERQDASGAGDAGYESLHAHLDQLLGVSGEEDPYAGEVPMREQKAEKSRTRRAKREKETETPAGTTVIPTEHTAAAAVGNLPKAEKKTQEGASGETKVITPMTGLPSELKKKEYEFPSTELLAPADSNKKDDSAYIRDMAIRLKQTLDSFHVQAEIDDISCGPAVTRFEIVPDIGVKVSKIVSLTDDIKLNLAAKDIRIEAPIPGKAAIGIEVPNKENSMVRFRTLVETETFRKAKSKLSFCVGLDIAGKPVIADIQKMPHVLIAGATGSGKSVCINTLIMSILYKATPDEVRLLMVDPKVVELSVYNGIPHLLIPVVTDPKKAAGALNWAVVEMENRYKKFAELNTKTIFTYNEALEQIPLEERGHHVRMPQIVIIIDELADLMMVASSEVETAICRLAQLARASGIHLVIATQRPSVNVITGVIKANIPSRIAFAVSSGVDSRTILDMNGAEKLLGKGDMLFHPAGLPKPIRVQGAFIDEDEVQKVVDAVSVDEPGDDYAKTVDEKITEVTGGGIRENEERDEYFEEAARIIVEKDRASIGLLQRLLRVGFNRASRIMDQLFEAGVVGPDEGTKPRKILMSEEELNQLLGGKQDAGY